MNVSDPHGGIAAVGRLVRRATSVDGVIDLAAWLGFEPVGERVPQAAFGAYGFEPEAAVRGLVRAGIRGEFVALVLELEGDATPAATARLAHRHRAHAPVRDHLLLFTDPDHERLVLASFGLDGRLRRLVLERERPHPAQLEALCEMRPRDGEGGTALALRHGRALDRTRITRGFFRDLKALRSRAADGWRHIPGSRVSERNRLALLLLCRLMFLYFLQRDGHLAGDPRYLPARLRDWRRGNRPDEGTEGGTFYRSVLVPLFFGALNTRPAMRSPAARALGPLPYLNGGLFERHALERRFAQLDLADEVVYEIFDGLLERYRFTTREPTDTFRGQPDDFVIDPEMLGRVFEGLMAPDERRGTGTYFTPATVVDRLTREALTVHLVDGLGTEPAHAAELIENRRVSGLSAAERMRLADAVARLRVLDPACGSGAFLLGLLSGIARVRGALEPGKPPRTLRREVVGRSLHGVDLQDDAALLCALRLWLSLAHGANPNLPPPPLPNLDRRVCQGNALIDPLDLGEGIASRTASHAARLNDAVRRHLRTLQPLARRYLDAGPDDKPELRQALDRTEAALARAWMHAADKYLRARQRELRAAAQNRDLFGERSADALTADAALAMVERRRAELARHQKALRDGGALPFFSFRVRFAEAAGRGFDIVLSNPPWLRAHRWPAALRETTKNSYAVCRNSGWRPPGAGKGVCGAGAQVDLAMLFLERSLRLLAPGGTLGMLLPAKATRSLYGAAARRMLLREANLAVIEDHSLDTRGMFQADAFPAAVIARKRSLTAETGKKLGPHGSAPVKSIRITMTHRNAEPLRFTLPPEEVPVLRNEPASAWLLAPPDALAAFRRMQTAGRPLGAHSDLRVRRGVVTGANDILIIEHAEPKLNGLAIVRARGDRVAKRAGRPAAQAKRYRALIEGECLCPLVRGSGVSSWRIDTPDWLLWTHDDTTAEASPAPQRTASYLQRHADALRARSGWRPGRPLGGIFHATPDTTGAKVLWHDLAETLKAVAVPARVRGLHGRDRPLIPLNTVYFIPVDSYDQALPLVALLNSTAVRAFARAVAQRAKDLRFRFLAWTIRLIPLPVDWSATPAARRLADISRRAHERGALESGEREALESAVAQLYGLRPEDRRAIAHFDNWLRGEEQ